MILTLICTILVLWLFYVAFKFYRSADWDDPAESSPDFAEMRKKEAQLLHIQDVLQEACDLGKLSKTALEEYIRYADMEIAQMEAAKKAWEARKGDVQSN